jgi:YbgC/YbaW family acyl-CoA thioester hydrolase
MFVYGRTVRFEEVDFAGLVFFANYLHFAHETMERFFDDIPGSYAGLIGVQKLGFPTVKSEVTHHAPLRYGDSFQIEMSVSEIGKTSCVFNYRVLCVKAGGVAPTLAASIRQTCVLTHLDGPVKTPIVGELREHLERHRRPE